MTLRKSRVVFIVLMLLFKAALDVLYVEVINPTFGYAGFAIIPDSLKYLESWLLFILMVLFIPDRINKPSDFLLFIFFLDPIAPMLSLYGLSNQDRLYTYAVTIVFFLFVVLRSGPSIKIPYIKNGTSIAIYLSLLFILLALINFGMNGAFSKMNFNLAEVYTHREEIGGSIKSGIWGYIVPWVSKLFTITILAIALFKKKYMIALFIVMFQIMLFGITSHKAVALYPIFALTLFFLRNVKYVMTYCVGLILALLMSCYIAFMKFEQIVLASLFVRRVFFVPALNNYYYYDYFSKNGNVFLSHGSLSSFIDYPFHLPPVNLIASTYYGEPEMAANTGFIATSYMNFGFVGMLLFGSFVALLLKSVDSFSQGDKPVWFYLSLVIVPFSSLFKSSEFLTTMLTGGLALSLIVAWLTYNKPFPSSS